MSDDQTIEIYPDHAGEWRFWERVHVGALDECWPWTGPVNDRVEVES